MISFVIIGVSSMRKPFAFLVFAGLALFGVLGLPGTGSAQPNYEKEIYPLFQRFCHECHNPSKKRGGLDLASLKSPGDVAKNATMWPGLAERIQVHEMPPEGSKQPSNQDRKRMVDWAIAAGPKEQDNCNQLANDRTVRFYRGHVMSRRLTRGEYDNTIRDLIGLDLKPGTGFPTDGSGGVGFDTVGDALFTSTIHVEQYLDAAELVLDAVFKDGGGPLGQKFSEKDRAVARKRLLVAEPDGQLPPREAAEKVLVEFARRAYRRPVQADELAKLLYLFDRAMERGDSWHQAIRLPLKGVLISPNFLFLVEPENEDDGVHPLPDFPLASRLSYFLWASMPDQELLHLAGQGKLQDKEVLRQQTRRMLKDPKARGFAEAFVMQWLDLRPLGETVRPDPERFPEFDDELAEAMRAEVVSLFQYVISEDRSLLDLIDPDYTFVNDRLAQLYGIPNVQGSELRKVQLTDKTRGGILAAAAPLTVTSYPLRTSPVLRGRWVLEEVLGSRVPPPPPNAGELPPDDKPTNGLTLRQQLEVHRKNPDCAACHARMDPLGFGLENFDPIGRWRTEAGGSEVDATGELPGGKKFNGPVELKKVVLERKNEFARNLSRKMVGYALGRQLYKFDQCVVDEGVKALAKHDYKPSVLIEEIVLSYPFRHRFVKK